jgi:hypothetical protein
MLRRGAGARRRRRRAFQHDAQVRHESSRSALLRWACHTDRGISLGVGQRALGAAEALAKFNPQVSPVLGDPAAR